MKNQWMTPTLEELDVKNTMLGGFICHHFPEIPFCNCGGGNGGGGEAGGSSDLDS